MLVKNPKRFKWARVIADPEKWPQRPFMAMKRSVGNTIEHGIMADMPGHELRIYDTNLFKLNMVPGATYEEKLGKLQCIRYKSANELVEDGWLINA